MRQLCEPMTASRIRLIALDLDGTLLSSSSEIPEDNLRAIQAAVDAGIEVALVTGRRFDFARPIAEMIPCPVTMIVNNGALVRSRDGTTHLRHLLPRRTALELLGQMETFRRRAALVFDRVRENQVIYEEIEWHNPRRRPYLLRNREYIAQVSPIEMALTEDPIQLMYSGDPAMMRSAEALLRASPLRDSFSLAVTYYDHMDFAMIDLIHPGCSKGATLAEWTARRGYLPAEVMAIGDNYNDREMLEFAGLPVVMANAVSELKNRGWRETLSNDRAGVAAAIDAYALNAGIDKRTLA
jgi:Cof subfamily protein (haloacid dehalogenase superfamily)